MVGSVASSSARSNQGVERFYHPPARRKQLELEQQLLQQQQQQQQLQQQQMHQQQQQQQHQQQQQQPQQQQQQQQHHQQQQPSQQQHPHRHHHHGSRHHHHSQQQQQQQQPRPARQRVRAPMAVAAAAAAAAAASVEAREAETRAVESDDSTKHSVASVSNSVSAPVSTAATSSIASSSSPSPPPRPPTPQGNLNQFIDSVTPLVNANYLIKPGPRGWRSTEDRLPYYVLDDLWETFSEWSAYGAGVPIVLNGTDSVVQYYVPYLSAIQLYVKDPSKQTPVRTSDGELYRDTSSEGSNECGADRRSMHIQEGNRRLTERLSRISLTENAHGNLEGSSSDDGEAQNSPGLLKFEYLERESPYGREPLTEKVSVLARQCPELKTYKSYELLPSSWLSVAWYPIYRIPTGPTLRDLESCFLTFHLLTPCKGIKNGYRDPGASTRRSSSSSDGSSRIPLPVLGLASYKFRDSVWITNGLCERQQVNSLLQAADSWVRGLQVDHPDLRFFMSHSAHYWR